ncbi:MAG: inositol monophosphatase [Verrucomicrobiae bacterium]|nr:inositol monophosphatase [Verrucomicrobiae bacterium]
MDKGPHLDLAIEAVREAGELLKRHRGSELVVNESKDHDIKLELDLQSHRLLTEKFRAATPDFAILSEEGQDEESGSPHRWIIDPIDGTVNFFYGIPHYCITVALQKREGDGAEAPYRTVLGVTYDPNRDELFSAEAGAGAFLNGRPIRVSRRSKVAEAVLAIGFSKTNETARASLGHFQHYATRAKKLRVMGAAALDLAYVAAGRLDAYFELVRIWDYAAGLLLVQEAGGRAATQRMPKVPFLSSVLAFNGALPFELRDGDLWETPAGAKVSES